MVRARLRILFLLCGLPFLAILGRLTFLQLVETERYRTMADAQGRTVQLIRPRRGRILSRDGTILAENRIHFDLHYTLDNLHPRERCFARLEKLLRLCDVSEHRRNFEICTCQHLEGHLAVVIGSPESLDLEILRNGEPSPVPLVENVPPSIHRRIVRMRELKESMDRLGLFFRADEPTAEGRGEPTTHTLWVHPHRIARMELALLRLARRTGTPYGGPGAPPETLRGNIASAVKQVHDIHGGEDFIANKKNLGRRNHQRRRERLLVRGVDRDVVTEVLYNPERFPGILVRKASRRHYPPGEVTGIVTGYLTPVDSEILDGWKAEDRILDPLLHGFGRFFEEFRVLRQEKRNVEELLGATGLEKVYDDRLRGRYGAQMALRDAIGRPLASQPFEPIEPIEGEDLRTTLDLPLQEAIWEELARQCAPGPGAPQAGTAVVMALRKETGAVEGVPGAMLAVACYPTYDPNRILDGDYYNSCLEDPRKPLNNRARQVTCPPGSVFKLIVAVAAMESGRVRAGPGQSPRLAPWKPRETYTCNWIFDPRYRGYFRCNSRIGHGTLDVSDAIKVSCNCFFYHLARERLSAGVIWNWAWNFGFGRGVGIDLDHAPGEQPRRQGVLRKELPYKEMPAYGIGQGPVTATPLQVLRAVAAIALDGRGVPWPYLVTPRMPERLTTERPTTMPVIREGMRRAIAESRGTAARVAYGLGAFSAAVKTGTAEITNEGDEHYAWVAGFAPFERPEIAFVVCMERTTRGGGEATAPVLEVILDHFAARNPDRYRQGFRGPTR